jgi:hypothetical protein
MTVKAEKLREIAREAFRRGEKDAARDIWAMAKAEDEEPEVEEEEDEEVEEEEKPLEADMSDDEIDAELTDDDEADADVESDLPPVAVASLKKLAAKVSEAGHDDLAEKITAALS